MKPLFYIMRKSIKNYIKNLKTNPAALVGVIFYVALLILVIGISIFGHAPKKSELISKEMYSVIMGGIILGLLYMNLKFAMSNGQSFFRMSDVNFVFTSPILPRKVLNYGFLKQIKGILFMLVLLGFQMPLMKSKFPIKSYGILIIFLGVALFIFSLSIINMVLYAVASKSIKNKKIVNRSINALVGIFAVVFLIQLFNFRNLKDAAIAIFNNPYYMYVPYIGWIQGVFNGAVQGINASFIIYLFINLIFTAIMIYVLYKSDMDYYEDVLGSTEYVEDLYKARKEGKTVAPKKVRKIKIKYSAEGAKSIFYRQILEYKKVGILFLDKSTLFMAIAGFGFAFIVKNGNINAVLYFTAYLLLFVTAQGKWSQELSKPYIYLIPAKSWSKVFYATLASQIKNLIDGTVLFVIAGIFFKTNPIMIVLCILCYTSFGFIYTYGSVLAKRLFGMYSKALGSILSFLIVILIVSPGITGFLIFYNMYKHIYIIKLLSYGILIMYNVIASIILLFLSKGIFEKIEVN